ncbi:unnamed protein product, partial [marine sediment metagenome]
LSFGSRLFISTNRGLGVLRGAAITSLKGKDGLPFEETTCLEAGFENDIWIGTTKGAIRMLKDDWLFIHALEILGTGIDNYLDLFTKIFDHTIDNGIDKKYGGVFVEGPHSGGVYDMEKEFWQQAEVMIGVLDAWLLFGKEKYRDAYKNVHRFVFDKVINRNVGEWYPLLTREGEPIWTHMGHSWKINYHTVRAMIQSIRRLKKIAGQIH